MNFFKRALANITRGKTKSILLIVTFFLIGNLVIVGLGITSAADNAKTAVRKTMNPIVTVETDYNAYYEYVDSLSDEERDEIYNHYEDYYPYITEENIGEMMKDSRVVAVSALQINTAYAKSYESVPLNNEYEKNNGASGGESCYYDEDGNETCTTYVEPDTLLKSNMYPDMIEFHTGAMSIVEGRFYTQDEIDDYAKVCLITEEFAEYNNLKVGDSLEVSIANPSELTEMSLDEDLATIDCEIIGIYHTESKVDENSDNFDWMSKYESPYNVILLPQTAYAEVYCNYMNAYMKYWGSLYGNDETTYEYTTDSFVRTSSVTIMLDDPLNVEDFVNDYKDQVGEYRKVSSDNSTFNQMARPLDTLSLFANIIVWIVVINAVVIITLVTALTLKNREYEIGVMLSIGVTKAKIVMQFFVELLIVAILGFTLATISGSLIAGKIGDMVLEYQVNTENSYSTEEDGYYYTYTSVWDTNYYTTVTQEQILAEYKVEISPLLIAEIYALGLGVVFISILIPSAMIMRFNPKKILMSTN